MDSITTPKSQRQSQDDDARKYTYLVGIGVKHSIAPSMHNYVARQLGYDWEFQAVECPTIEEAVALFRSPTCAGAVVTMPYKATVMPYLDGLDDYARKLGACNNVYRAKDGTLRGTNTDWVGVEGCLTTASTEGKGKPAFIIGAGGAARAALYALHILDCQPVYIVNRDVDEVNALRNDWQRGFGSSLQLIHLQSADEVSNLPQLPFYAVGTVPDFEAVAPAELEARAIFERILSSATEDGVFLDMCFKPRWTRNRKLADRYGWKTVEGTHVIGHQIFEQYRLWCSEEESRSIPKDGAWEVLMEAAENSTAINF